MTPWYLRAGWMLCVLGFHKWYLHYLWVYGDPCPIVTSRCSRCERPLDMR